MIRRLSSWNADSTGKRVKERKCMLSMSFKLLAFVRSLPTNRLESNWKVNILRFSNDMAVMPRWEMVTRLSAILFFLVPPCFSCRPVRLLFLVLLLVSPWRGPKRQCVWYLVHLSSCQFPRVDWGNIICEKLLFIEHAWRVFTPETCKMDRALLMETRSKRLLFNRLSLWRTQNHESFASFSDQCLSSSDE